MTAEVQTGTGYTVGSTSSASVTVEDNDDPASSPQQNAPEVTISADATSVTEGTAATFTNTGCPPVPDNSNNRECEMSVRMAM